MGTYLSVPIVEKDTEEGIDMEKSSTLVSWAVVDMQGWRKTMEDAHLAQTNVTTTAESSSDTVAQVFAVFDGHGGSEVARFCSLYLVDVLKSQPEWENGKDVGRALINSFHSLDRMIADRNRRKEILDLQLQKPEHGSMRKLSETAPIPKQAIHQLNSPGVKVDTDKTGPNAENLTEEKEGSIIKEANKPADTSESNGIQSSTVLNTISTEEEKKESILVEKDELPSKADDDSEKVLVDKDDIDDDDLDEFEDANEDGVISNTDALKLFQKLLSLKGNVSIIQDDENDQENTNKSNEFQKVDGTPNITPAPTNILSASQPSRTVNGRKICNLPDFEIHAGCTAVCAVILNRNLYVANAGDSRAVLCRAGGKTTAMSFDHKPLQDREMNRITKAGGFVNQFGRVNGNLNLSRAIGDLKYKQVPGIPPSEQMITAEPDIKHVELEDDDEFIILACDGIWDCLTNEEAVKYVADRIDKKSPKEIGIEMLDEIISVDPRKTQGIGGDNMTVMIIDMQPQKRSLSMDTEKSETNESTTSLHEQTEMEEP